MRTLAKIESVLGKELFITPQDLEELAKPETEQIMSTQKDSALFDQTSSQVYQNNENNEVLASSEEDSSSGAYSIPIAA